MKYIFWRTYAKKLFHVRGEANTLFTLPASTIHALHDELGQTFLTGLERELEHLTHRTKLSSRYYLPDGKLKFQALDPDLRLLSSMSASGAALRQCFRIVRTELPYIFGCGRRLRWTFLVLELIKANVRPREVKKHYERIVDHVQDLTVLRDVAEYEGCHFTADGVRRTDAICCWLQPSFNYLYEIHTRLVGDTLAMKVAGHLLPTELVEIISEKFRE